MFGLISLDSASTTTSYMNPFTGIRHASVACSFNLHLTLSSHSSFNFCTLIKLSIIQLLSTEVKTVVSRFVLLQTLYNTTTDKLE